MKRIIYLLIGILLLGIASALDECGDSVPTNNDCSIITPIMSCGTYTVDIYYSNGTVFASDRTLEQISTSSIYNASINFTTADTYALKLSCNTASRSIIAVDEDLTSPNASWWSYLLMIYYNTLPGAW